MILDKALLLKGAAGFAAVGGVAGLGITAHSSGLFSSKETKRLRDINGRLDALGLSGCRLEAKDLQQDSKIFSKECQLNKEQFQKIKFSNMGDGDLTIGSWAEGQTATLKIEEKSLEDKSFKFTFTTLPSSSLTVTGGENKSMTINQNDEFEEKRGRLNRIVDQALKTKLEGINGKLETLGISTDCKFDVNAGETTIECPLSEQQLKALKFSNREDGGELTIKGNVSNTLKIKIEAKDSENDTIFSFTGLSEDLNVFGGNSKGKIVIGSEKREFKDVNGKLTKTASNNQSPLGGFNTTLGTLNIPLECRFDEAENVETVECEATEDELKAINFSNKGEGSGTIKVKNLSPGTKVKIKVEKDTSDQKMKVTFPELSSDLIILGDSSEGRIDIKKNENKKFKEDNGKLTKETSNDNNLVTKLKGYNTQLGKLNLPEECKYDEHENTSATLSCTLTKDQFKNINFWNREGNQALTIDKEEDLTVTNIEVKEESKSGTQKLKFNFKGMTKPVKVTGANSKSFNFRKEEGDQFEIRNSKLGQIRKGIESDAKSLGLTCTYEGDGNNGTCKVANGDKVKVATGDQKGEITVTDCNESCFTFSEYEDTYNQTIKFTYTGNGATGSDNLKLEKNASYNSENKEGSKYLVKKDPSSR